MRGPVGAPVPVRWSPIWMTVHTAINTADGTSRRRRRPRMNVSTESPRRTAER